MVSDERVSIWNYINSLIKRVDPFLLAAVTLSAGFFVFSALVIGIHPGRDIWTYELYYRQFFMKFPSAVLLQLFRTPGVPFYYGPLFDLGGWMLVLIMTGFFFIVGMTLFYLVMAHWNKWLALIAIFLLLLRYHYMQNILGVASESLMALVVLYWLYFLFKAYRRFGNGDWSLVGIIIGILIMIRPGNSLMMLSFFLPLLYWEKSFKVTVKRCLSCMLPCVIVLLCYVSYNYLRFDFFGIAALGNAHLPFYRAYVQEGLIRPENGPASQKLKELIQKRIISKKVFQDYGVSIDDMFMYSTSRMFQHVVKEVYLAEGWDSHAVLLKKAAWESAAANPRDFWLTYVQQLMIIFGVPYRWKIVDRPYHHQVIEQQYNLRLPSWQKKGLRDPVWIDDILPENHGADWLSHRPPGYRINESLWLRESWPPKTWNLPTTETSQLYSLLSKLYQKTVTMPISMVMLLCLFPMIGIKRNQEARFVLGIVFIGFLTLALSILASVQISFRYPFDPVWMLGAASGCYTASGHLRKYRQKKIQKSYSQIHDLV